MTQLSPLVRKLLAVFILVVGVSPPFVAGYVLITHFLAKEADIVQKREDLARLEAIARYGTRLDTKATETQADAFSSWFLTEADSAIAAAGLQAKLKSVARAHGIDVIQANGLKGYAEKTIGYVGVNLDMTGLGDGVHETLKEIERALPLLIVDKLTLRADLAGGDPRYDPIRLILGVEIRAALRTPLPPETGTTP